MLRNSLIMRLRAVAFVALESVIGILFGIFYHHAISRNLCNDGSSGDGDAFGISLDNARLGQVKPFQGHGVNQKMLNMRPAVFHERLVRIGNRLRHGSFRRIEYVDFVYDTIVAHSDAPRKGF